MSQNEAWGVYPQKPVSQVDFEKIVHASAEKSVNIDPFQEHFEVGSLISAVQAKAWNNSKHSDIRPRLYDTGSKVYKLIDTGSMISTTAKKPEDKLNPNMVLQAVNNSPMKTYGFRKVDVKIGRKTYQVEAVVVDLGQEILGMDFLNTYKLGLDWIDDEYYIFDRRAQIKKSLSFVTVPEIHVRTQALVHLEDKKPDPNDLKRPQMHPDWISFQVSCMKALTSDASQNQNIAESNTSRDHETFQNRGKIQTDLLDEQLRCCRALQKPY